MKSALLSIALAAAAASASAPAMASLDLAKKHNCTACHAVDKKLVGPSYKDVAAKHKGKPDAAMLAEKIKKGGSGVYGPVPMPPNASVPDADIKVLVDWIMSGAK
ncbi:MAG: c-type cytochrome [Burkholderiaceae bacterium]|nr:c-type cytochrome [Burkholderiaceae bacterium]